MKVWAIITQRQMHDDKWCIIEVNEYNDPPTIRAPFDSQEEAVKREQEICKDRACDCQIIIDEVAPCLL